MKNKKDIINSLKKALEELDITSSLRLPIIQTIEYLQEDSVNNGLDLGCGVIWRDEEPVSIWHDASEEPDNKRNIVIWAEGFSNLIVVEEYRSREKKFYYEFGDHYYNVDITRKGLIWAYVDDLLNLTKKEEPVNEELEEAAKRYATEGDEISGLYIIDEEVEAFKAGAKWQKEQDKQWLAEGHKHIFAKGRDSMKQQIMAKAFDFTKEHNTACVLASECLRNHGWFSRERDFNDLFRHLSCVDKLFEGKFSGKTKVIVIKED